MELLTILMLAIEYKEKKWLQKKYNKYLTKYPK